VRPAPQNPLPAFNWLCRDLRTAPLCRGAACCALHLERIARPSETTSLDDPCTRVKERRSRISGSASAQCSAQCNLCGS
jgi:hypothetical protein